MENEIKGKYVVITGKLSAYVDLTGTNEKAIFIPQEDLDEIGITKCFDVVNNTVINFDNTKDLTIVDIRKSIAALKQKLKDTDYKAIKYAEGFITDYDYLETRKKRQGYRDQINKLEEELANLTSEV